MDAGTRRPGSIAGINVTPMADIVIVLLVIFMVATSAMSRDPFELPPAAHPDETKGPDEVVVSVSIEGQPTVDGRSFPQAESLGLYLEERLAALPAGRRIVFVKAPEDLPYAAVARVADACRRAGFEEVGLMTSPRPYGNE
jgi:biopolymer transport protein ExbD